MSESTKNWIAILVGIIGGVLVTGLIYVIANSESPTSVPDCPETTTDEGGRHGN